MDLTPEQEARYAFDRGLGRETLSPAAQAVWDELEAAEAELEAIRAEHARLSPAGPPRSSHRFLIYGLPPILLLAAAVLLAIGVFPSRPEPVQPAPGSTVTFSPSPPAAVFSPLPSPAARP
jgi:hypothetical protein